MSFRKIWIFYGVSLLWMLFGIAAVKIGNNLNNISYSDYSIGDYIGEFFVITGPLWIVISYDQIKRHKEKLKHAILKR